MDIILEILKLYGIPGLFSFGMWLVLRGQIASAREDSKTANDAVEKSNEAQGQLRKELQASRDEARDLNKQKETEITRLRTEMAQLQQRETAAQIERNRMREQMDQRERETAQKFGVLNQKVKENKLLYQAEQQHARELEGIKNSFIDLNKKLTDENAMLQREKAARDETFKKMRSEFTLQIELLTETIEQMRKAIELRDIRIDQLEDALGIQRDQPVPESNSEQTEAQP